MTREERLDWLCRLRSGLVWFDVPPKERPMFENALSEEIKALSAEPCEDAINRQMVLDTLDTTDKFMDEDRTVETYKALLKECYVVLPSVAPKQKMGRWIPVSERLPELGEKVLCQCRAGIYEVLKLTVNGWYFDIDHCYMESFVTAWMPIPEPYLLEKPTGSNSEEESEDTDGK